MDDNAALAREKGEAKSHIISIYSFGIGVNETKNLNSIYEHCSLLVWFARKEYGF